jgi:hypothetical protein
LSRWNVLEIGFYGEGGRRRTIGFTPDEVNIITGASGTGKSAIIDAIDYCLGSSSCGLPFFVREHAIAVAVHWVMDDNHLILGRDIPRAGKGTDIMYVRTGRDLSIPLTTADFVGQTNRDTARALIERAFGIGDIDNPDVKSVSSKSRATIRDITPYLFLSGDVIINKSTLFHDMNRPDKARDIIATLPFFLGAIDQESVLAERRLRQLQAAFDRLTRDVKAREKSVGRLRERSIALLTQAASLGLAPEPSSESTNPLLIKQLRAVQAIAFSDSAPSTGSDITALDDQRLSLVRDLQILRDKRRAINLTIKDASGYDTAVSGQSHKLGLVQHLKLEAGKCPVCEAENTAAKAMADRIRISLEVVNAEVNAMRKLRPELAAEAQTLNDEIETKASKLREIEAQIGAIIRQITDRSSVNTLAMERSLVSGRIRQFLEMTDEDNEAPSDNLKQLEDEILTLRDKVDPEAKRDRLRDAENLIGGYATDMLAELPSEIPVTDSRVLFSASPAVKLVEPVRRAALSLPEIGSDQNYLAIHLALTFALQKHLETIHAPVPGLIVIDQISRPYYPEGGDEKTLGEMSKDADRIAMRKIVDFVFKETDRRKGLQVILIEHAYISDNKKYVGSIKGRWTKKTNEKLIPVDWPARS